MTKTLTCIGLLILSGSYVFADDDVDLSDLLKPKTPEQIEQSKMDTAWFDCGVAIRELGWERFKSRYQDLSKPGFASDIFHSSKKTDYGYEFKGNKAARRDNKDQYQPLKYTCKYSVDHGVIDAYFGG